MRAEPMRAEAVRKRLQALGSREAEALARRFFKTGPGEYGEGDRFRGIKVPIVRRVASECRGLSFVEAKRLLASPFHEDRLAALDILAWQFKRGDEALRGRIYRLYLGGARWINNWDLVDASAPQILGAYLEGKDKAPLYKLARSGNLWERRMAMLATLWYIRKKDFADALRIARLLVASREDLLHKAVGWMLREVGKRDRAAEEAFLARHCRTMPRTMLRYAIEHFPESLRQAYLKGAK
ncbi:MAG TPA: DNA alkylation repair protein [Fibrobacteria bacterium]|nr:DNA alkylation repair protein [Fibrobacteria bacterium]